MSDEKQSPITCGGVMTYDEMPPNPRKRSILWNLPQTQRMAETIRAGIPANGGTFIRLNLEDMAKLGVKDARKALRRLFEIFIENGGFRTTSGTSLGVEDYRSIDNDDIVRVVAKEMIAPPRFCHSPRRTRKETENKLE